MTSNTETDLHTLLDGLTDGEHIKATWKVDQAKVTAEGPVVKVEKALWCDRLIRWGDGVINPLLTSFEVARGEEITITRDDEDALNALIASLEGGETVTAEWGNEGGSMSITGRVRASGATREMHGYGNRAIRRQDFALHSGLHSITVRRPVVQRWEREDDE